MISSTIHRFLQHLYKLFYDIRDNRPYYAICNCSYIKALESSKALSPFTSCFIICRHFETISCVPWIHESFHVLKQFAILLPEVLWKQKVQSGIINLAGYPGHTECPDGILKSQSPPETSPALPLWGCEASPETRGKGYDMQGLEAPASHLWIHGGDANRARPDVETTDWPEEVKDEAENLNLRKKITEWAAGFLSGAKVTGLVSYQCW